MLDQNALFARDQIPTDLLEFFEPADCGACYVCTMVDVFRGVRRVLRDDGTLWLNIGDSYANKPVGSFNGGGFKDTSAQNGTRNMSGVATSGTLDKLAASGLKIKDLMMVPARLAIALQDDGWYLRSDIIWAKPNPMPESVRDRPTSAHEHIFLLTKQARYYWDQDAVREPHTNGNEWIGRQSVVDLKENSNRGDKGAMPTTGSLDGRNLRNVWTITTHGFPEAHFATFPPEIPRRCIKAGSREGDTVLDPFLGSGTTLLVADQLGRNGVGIELNSAYAEMARRRIHDDCPMFADIPA